LLGQGTFVYTNNDDFFLNSVSAFSVGANGSLVPVAGSPFATGGTGSGTLFAPNRITTAIVKDFLYAGNERSNDVSAFSINPTTGVLTLVAGSPFATGGIAGGGISLATTPDDNFLIAANSASENLTVYSIAANGALSLVPGSPFPAGPGGLLYGIKITPDGKFLAVARDAGVSMFSISALGGLMAVPGSPFTAGGTGVASGIDCNCSSSQLFIGEGGDGTIVSVQNIALNGALSPVSGSPFIGPGVNSAVVVLNPDDSKLFVSNQVSKSVTVFSVAATGALTLVPGSPFPAGPGTPSGMATNQAGTFLYAAEATSLISGFSIAPSGALTSVPGSPFSTGTVGSLIQPQSLTVFPPKSCCLAPVITGASATPNLLWPPNHKFVDVTIDYTVTDHCRNTCVLTVSSNEPPVDDKEPEWVVVDAHHLQLRAERLGSGAGRTYTITITCTNDTNKQSSTQTVTVLVPHDQRK
jgi:6-phosphogluconolactonase (cycloisomerase 2 family)